MIEVPIEVSQSSKPATHWLIIPERCNFGSGSEFKRGPSVHTCSPASRITPKRKRSCKSLRRRSVICRFLASWCPAPARLSASPLGCLYNFDKPLQALHLCAQRLILTAGNIVLRIVLQHGSPCIIFLIFAEQLWLSKGEVCPFPRVCHCLC